jgi:uncharacterized membrane protein (UPF0127 family)
MPGQATVTIGDRQWQVSIADTPWELAQGLGGLPELAPGTGVLFDTGWTQIIQVTTVPMLFPLDIAFLSETAVVTEVYRSVEPGYIVISTLPARYFLEVNAGELEGIEPGDQVSVEFLPLEEIPVVEADWMAAVAGFMGFTVMAVFVTALARDFVSAALKPQQERPVLYGPRGERLLPLTEPQPGLAARILEGLKGKEGAYRAYVRYPPDKSAFVVIGSIVGGHYSWNPQGFSVWVSSWKEDPEWPRDSILHIREMRPARSYEATEEGVRKALAYVESEFPAFTESAWVSKSIPVHVAQELGILRLEHLPQTTGERKPIRTIDARGRPISEVYNIHRQYPPHLFRAIGSQYSHATTERDIEEFRKRAAEAGAVVLIVQEYGLTAYVPIKRASDSLDVWETRAVVLEDTLTGMPGFQDRLSSLEDWLVGVERELFPTRDAVRRTVERFPGRFGVTKDNVVYLSFAQFPANTGALAKEALPAVRVMPKLPPEAYKDFLFCEYIRDLVRLGETITAEEARLMWEAWKKREPQRLPSVVPREGEYSWLITDPETGEMMIKTGYATVSKAKRAARDFALRRARYAGDHRVKLRIYDGDPDIGNLEAGVVFEGRVLVPEGTIEPASPGAGRFKPGEIARYKGERVRISEQIGDRVNIFIPSRQELVWVKPEALERIEEKEPAVIPAGPTGTCYADAWRFLIREEEGELVHGTVFSGGRRIGHAWVETATGWVWEPQTGRYFTKLGFRDAFAPDVESRYTAEEAAIMAARTKHFGPWTEQERRRYLKGKPPAVVPTGPRRPRPRRKDELEFLPDSPEFLAYTIDDIGYREKIDNAFQEAIKRAKALH